PEAHGHEPTALSDAAYAVSPLIDLLVGLTYVYRGDSRKVREHFSRIEKTLSRVLPAFDCADEAAAAPVNSAARAVLTAMSLGERPRHETTRADAFLQRIHAVAEEWAAHNPISLLFARSRDEQLTCRIASVEVHADTDEVHLLADADPKKRGFGDMPP